MEPKYYKISPEWAAKLNVTHKAYRHPDGWYMVLPTVANRLARMLSRSSEGAEMTADESITHIGGRVYNQDQVLKSQNGDPDFRMDMNEGKQPEPEPFVETEEPAEIEEPTEETEE